MGKNDIKRSDSNGKIVCDTSLCKLKCDAGYDNYGARGTVRCKQHLNKDVGLNWNTDIGSCRTCSGGEPNSEIRRACKFTK